MELKTIERVLDELKKAMSPAATYNGDLGQMLKDVNKARNRHILTAYEILTRERIAMSVEKDIRNSWEHYSKDCPWRKYRNGTNRCSGNIDRWESYAQCCEKECAVFYFVNQL